MKKTNNSTVTELFLTDLFTLSVIYTFSLCSDREMFFVLTDWLLYWTLLVSVSSNTLWHYRQNKNVNFKSIGIHHKMCRISSYRAHYDTSDLVCLNLYNWRYTLYLFIVNITNVLNVCSIPVLYIIFTPSCDQILWTLE